MESFEKICEKNYERIHRYIFGMTGDAEAAKDLTQEVFFIAYQKGKVFLHHENPEGFLYMTAKNLIMADYRKRKREVLAEPGEHNSGQRGDIFEEICHAREETIFVEWYREEILEQLSAKKRQLYDLYYVKKKSMKEIAQELGFNEFALRMRYVRLRREIKEQVERLHLGEF